MTDPYSVLGVSRDASDDEIADHERAGIRLIRELRSI